MTPTVEELRDWIARLMGYRVHKGERRVPGISPPIMVPYVEYYGEEGQIYLTPDTDLNQVFLLVVPRMKTLGWWLDLFTTDEGFKAVFFKEIGGGAAIEHEANDVDVGNAILLAAHATGEGR